MSNLREILTGIAGGIVVAIIVLVIGFSLASPAQGNDLVAEQLNETGADYIYIYNRTNGEPDTVIILDEEMIDYVCSIEGIDDVTLNDVVYVCADQ